jgi:serine/threonine protein kinase
MHDPSSLLPGLCPPAEELSAFVAGRLPTAELETVASHLGECTHCLARVDQMMLDTDPLVAELRKPAEPDTVSDTEARRATSLVESLSEQVTRTAGDAAGLRAPVELPPELGQYELLEKLGEGGMGSVYKARHKIMRQIVALKVIHQGRLDQQSALTRFLREIQALARLDHPHIVRAQYADRVGDTHFLVMEFVPGVNLTDLVRSQGPLPIALACDYIRQSALGLQHAHEQGLVHRDIKPSNLLLTPEGMVKILDLGLALLQCEGAGDELTATGQVMGTFDYMAPEQWDDTHAVDIRADVYSLGCTLYFLLTGRPPFFGPEFSSQIRKMKAHASAPPPPLRQFRPDVPPVLEAVLERMLAKDPQQRQSDPAEVAADLEPFTAGVASPARREPVLRRPHDRLHESATALDRRPGSGGKGAGRKRRWWLGIAAGVAAAVVLGGTGLALWLPSRPLEGDRLNASLTSGPWNLGPGKRERRAGAPGGLEVVVAPPVRIQELKIEHYGREGSNKGLLGVGSFAARENEGCVVTVRLGEPAYFYLIAFNTDGEDQLLYPASKKEAPAKQKALVFPPNSGVDFFKFTDGPGLQAIAVVASREPLPSYNRWTKSFGVVRWRQLQPHRYSGVWKSDGIKTVQMRPATRGTVDSMYLRVALLSFGQDPTAGVAGVPWLGWYASMQDGPLTRTAELARSLGDRVGVDAVEVRSFPVLPAPKDE